MAIVSSGYFLLKILLSAGVIALVSELAKQHSFLAAFLVSLPLTSLLVFVWMHMEGQSNDAVAALASQTFWLVIPSLLFFIVFPYLLRLNIHFFLALVLASVATALAYGVMVGIQLRMGSMGEINDTGRAETKYNDK